MSNEPHWLVIIEEGEDYEIEHLPGCPTETYWIDPKGEPIKEYTCLVGALIFEAGLTDCGIEWDKLPVGRYALRGWSKWYPSTPMGPEEWDAGLEIEVPSAQIP